MKTIINYIKKYLCKDILVSINFDKDISMYINGEFALRKEIPKKGNLSFTIINK